MQRDGTESWRHQRDRPCLTLLLVPCVWRGGCSKDANAKGGQAVAIQGIRQGLEKKEGLFRMHMMGKRVNFACRCV